MEKIAIIGLGLMGSSLGMAIRQSLGKDVEIVGTDLETSYISTAKKMGAIDRGERTLVGAVEGVDIVVLATPVLAMYDVLEFIAPYLSRGMVVTDVGSTKADVVVWGEQLLPEGVSFIGGHPLAGKEGSGPNEADGMLFNEAVYAICPAPSATSEATKAVLAIVHAVGAKPYFVDPVEHDSYAGAVSHLPFLLSVNLVNTTTKSAGWREMSHLASTGFRDLSRLASGDPIMHRDIALTNRDAVVYWLDEFIKHLHELRNLVKEDQDGLENALVEAWEGRARWLLGRTPDDASTSEKMKSSDQFMGMLLGDTVAKKFRDAGADQNQDPTRYRKS